MKTKNKALLAGPFLVWTVAFIAIPLLMVIYYGFTGDDGSFTLENVKRILAPHYLKSLWLALLLSLVSTVACKGAFSFYMITAELPAMHPAVSGFPR